MSREAGGNTLTLMYIRILVTSFVWRSLAYPVQLVSMRFSS